MPGLDPRALQDLMECRPSGLPVGGRLDRAYVGSLAPLVYGLAPRDPVTLFGAAITQAVVGALAGWLPARRASRIDPAEVLRDS